MDRRIDRFQSKVQVNINLANDEIERLSQDLLILQGEVDSVKDQLNRTNIQLDQVGQAATGIQNREKAENKMKIARQKIKNETQINEIVQNHKAKVAEIQRDYQESLDKLGIWAEKKEAQKLAPLEEQLNLINEKRKKYEFTINSASETIMDNAGKETDAVQSIEFARIASLQNSIKQKNGERLQLLNRAKDRLAECVERLDTMETNHKLEINSLQSQLNSLDESYQMRERLFNERSENEILRLKSKYKKVRGNEEIIKDAIDKVERNQKKQMMSAVMEGEDLKHAMEIYQSRSIGSENNSNSFNEDNSQSELEYLRLKKLLEKRENELIKSRTENESLKRELARLKHELAFKKKRKSSSLIE